MGACAQIAVFTYAVMRLAAAISNKIGSAFLREILPNSVAHCGCHLPRRRSVCIKNTIFKKMQKHEVAM